MVYNGLYRGYIGENGKEHVNYYIVLVRVDGLGTRVDSFRFGKRGRL